MLFLWASKAQPLLLTSFLSITHQTFPSGAGEQASMKTACLQVYGYYSHHKHYFLYLTWSRNIIIRIERKPCCLAKVGWFISVSRLVPFLCCTRELFSDFQGEWSQARNRSGCKTAALPGRRRSHRFSLLFVPVQLRTMVLSAPIIALGATLGTATSILALCGLTCFCKCKQPGKGLSEKDQDEDTENTKPSVLQPAQQVRHYLSLYDSFF